MLLFVVWAPPQHVSVCTMAMRGQDDEGDGPDTPLKTLTLAQLHEHSQWLLDQVLRHYSQWLLLCQYYSK